MAARRQPKVDVDEPVRQERRRVHQGRIASIGAEVRERPERAGPGLEHLSILRAVEPEDGGRPACDRDGSTSQPLDDATVDLERKLARALGADLDG